MQKPVLTVITLALIIAATGCAPTAARPPGPGSALTAGELRALISGQTIRARGYGEQAELVYAANGTVSGSNPAGEKNDGRWSITPEGQLCQQFKRWGHGDRICYTVFKQGESYQEFTANGLLAYTLEVAGKPGEGGKPAVQTEPRPPAAIVTNPETTKSDLRYLVRETARNCPGCNLGAADLAGAELTGANLEGANLAGANLAGSTLRRANLRRAKLNQANLREADLKGADLEGADLTQADLTAAKLAGAKGLPHP